MPSFVDRTGQRFNRLLILHRDPTRVGKGAYWVCECDCGAIVTVRSCDFVTGHTQSCGCLNDEQAKKLMTIHGQRDSIEYSSWKNMWARCTNPNRPHYERYGGRGIAVCQRWSQFKNFYADMGPRPGLDYSIERKDNDGHYEPNNCIWATQSEQLRNRAKL